MDNDYIDKMGKESKAKWRFQDEIQMVSNKIIEVVLGYRIGSVSVDGILKWKKRRCGVVRFSFDEKYLGLEQMKLANVLKTTRLPIGIIVTMDKKFVTVEDNNGYSPFCEVDYDGIAEKISDYFEDVPLVLDNESVKIELRKRFEKSPSFQRKEDIKPIYEQAIEHLDYSIQGEVTIGSKEEDALFLSLLGEIEGETICRYTTMDNLFKLIEKKSQNMCSIASMNDPNEGSYADSKMSWIADVERRIPVINQENGVYLLSCSQIENLDNLTMWRLYGDDAKGVCFEYDVLKDRIDKENFFIAPVSYGQQNGSHPELEFINHLQSKPLEKGWYFKFCNWFRWKYFFKSYNYAIEKEVRLLYFHVDNKNRVWYQDSANGIFNQMVCFPITMNDCQFPLELSRIILGPKTSFPKKNQEQIRQMLDDSSIICLDIDISNIDNYR